MNQTGSQFSLRELMIIVLVAGMGLAGLRLGGVTASLLLFAAIVFLMGVAIVAFVGRGAGQAMAIGCLIPAIAYAATIVVIGQRELDPYEARMPTSQILRPVFAAFARQEWFNVMTGEVLADDDPAVKASGGGGGGFGGTPVGILESPDRATFMSLGHCLFAILFGYLGAKFARVVYRRRPVTTIT